MKNCYTCDNCKSKQINDNTYIYYCSSTKRILTAVESLDKSVIKNKETNVENCINWKPLGKTVYTPDTIIGTFGMMLNKSVNTYKDLLNIVGTEGEFRYVNDSHQLYTYCGNQWILVNEQ